MTKEEFKWILLHENVPPWDLDINNEAKFQVILQNVLEEEEK